MALQDFFVWGEGGSKKTPEQLDRERRLAQAMIASGVDMSPVGHWTQGAARMANALVGNIKQAGADKAERAGIEGAAKKFGSLDLANLLSGGAAYPSSVAAGGSPTSAAATGTVPQGKFNFGENADALRNGIVETAQAIGADPVDLATAISYETAGTFDPMKAGPRTQYGQHRGLIQFGEPQAEKYGVDWNNPLASQLGSNGAVANYFRSSGFKPGMSGLDLYSTINAGSPGRYSASDANNGGAPGDVRDKWENQMAGHRQKALALLGGGVDYTPTGSIADTPQQAIQAISPVADPEGLFAPGADVSQADLDFARQATGPDVSSTNAPAVAPYDFTGNPQLSSVPSMAFAPQEANNFDERWNAGAVPSGPVIPTPAVDPSATASIPAQPDQRLLDLNDRMFGGALAPQGAAPVQVADASGYFPAAPSADRAPVMGSYAAPVALQSAGNMQQLLDAASDPWMNDAQRAVINTALRGQLDQQNDARKQQAARENWLFQRQYQEQADARDPLRQAQIANLTRKADGSDNFKVVGNQLVRIGPNGEVTNVTPAATAEVGGKSINLDGLPPVSMSETGVPDAGSQNQFLQQLPPALAAQVKGISDGRIDISRVTSLRGGERQELAKLVSLYDPTWDMSQTGARVATRKDYATGEMAKMASSTNLAIQHMAGMVEEHGKMNNSSYPAWNWAANKLSTQTGDAAQRSFETYRLGVADELAKAFKGVGALNQQEVEEWKHAISTSSSPEQLRGAVVSALHMLAARTDTYEQRYRNVMGQDAPLFLTQNSLAALKKMGIDPSEVDPRYTGSSGAGSADKNGSIDDLLKKYGE